MAEKNDIVKRKIGDVDVDWSKSLGGPITRVPEFKQPAAEAEAPKEVDLSPFAILAERDAEPNSGPDAITHENGSALAVAEAAATAEKKAEQKTTRESDKPVTKSETKTP